LSFVEFAISAKNVHSQKNAMLFDRSKARELTRQEKAEIDNIFALMDINLKVDMSMENFYRIIQQ